MVVPFLISLRVASVSFLNKSIVIGIASVAVYTGTFPIYPTGYKSLFLFPVMLLTANSSSPVLFFAFHLDLCYCVGDRTVPGTGAVSEIDVGSAHVGRFMKTH